MEVLIGTWILLLLIIVILSLKFKIKFDVINNKTEKHYIVWYTASEYHQREYMLLYTSYK